MNIFAVVEDISPEGFIVHAVFDTLENAVKGCKDIAKTNPDMNGVIEEVPMNTFFTPHLIGETRCIQGAVAVYNQEGKNPEFFSDSKPVSKPKMK